MFPNNKQTFSFIQATLKHKELIFSWLKQPYVKKFWDNSQAHQNDIIHFMQGRKTPSTYCIGNVVYWVGMINNEPYCFLLTSEYEKEQNDLSLLHQQQLSKTGTTFSIDFMIGNTDYLGKSLAAPTLIQFMRFFKHSIEPKVDRLLIDPDETNTKAIHVYTQAGFKSVGTFPVKAGFFTGHHCQLMVYKFK